MFDCSFPFLILLHLHLIMNVISCVLRFELLVHEDSILCRLGGFSVLFCLVD